MSRSHTVREVADNYRVQQELVLGWIGTGLLPAINVAGIHATRPRWRISDEALAEFEKRRASSPMSSTKTHASRSSQRPIKQFF